MSVILLLILASLGLALAFLVAFIWAVRSGQYEDTCTPSLRVLMEAEPKLDITTGGATRQQFIDESVKPKALNFQTSHPENDFFRTH